MNRATDALEAAREGVRRFNEGDLAGYWELVHPDVVMATDEDWPGGGTYHGIEEYKRFLGQFLEAFSEVRFDQVGEPEIIGDATLVRAHWTGSGMASGIEASSVDFSVLTWAREGRMVEVRFFFDDAKAREFALSRT